MGICGNKDRRNKDAYGAPYRESDSGGYKSGSDNSSYSVNPEESKRQTPKITSQKPSLKAKTKEELLPARSLAPSPGSKPPSKQKLSKVSEKPEKKPKFTERLPSIPDKKISLST
jgi:hypothetical protein